MSKFRKYIGRSRSRKMFSRTASKVKKKNFRRSPMRGGYRI